MPGRHGKQRIVRKKSRSGRPRVTPMERMVTDSYFNRNRKEQAILAELVPTQKIEVKRVAAAPVSSGQKSNNNSKNTNNNKKGDGKEQQQAPKMNPTKYEHWTNKPQGKFAAAAAPTKAKQQNAAVTQKKKKQQLTPEEEAEKLLASIAGQ